MALLFADSFDHYQAVTGGRAVSGKWDLPSLLPNVNGRRGTLGGVGVLQKNFTAQTTMVVGCAMFVDREPSNFNFVNPALPEPVGGTAGFVLLNDSIEYLRLGLSSDGRLRLSRGAYPQVKAGEGGATYGNVGQRAVLWTSEPNVFQFASWNFLALYAQASSADTGVVKVELNGTVIHDATYRTVPLSPVDAFPFPVSFTQVRLGGPIFGFGSVDDLYVLNATGSVNNDFLGDVWVDLLRPDGPGAASDSVIVGTTPAATRWESQRTADGGVTAVQFNASGNADSYTYEDLPYETSTVYGVQVVSLARKSDAGPSKVAVTNTVNALSTDATPDLLTPSAGDTYAYLNAALDQSADGAWTLAKVQDSQFGIRREVLP